MRIVLAAALLVAVATPCLACEVQGRLPDPECTPGAVNPDITQKLIRSGRFRTSTVRDTETSPRQKQTTYAAYDIAKPKNNTGRRQQCELDHLVSLELGGADSLDNIWPQCGTRGLPLAKRFFKIKDTVENYLARQVKAGRMKLEDAQHGIAEDWTQYIKRATRR